MSRGIRRLPRSGESSATVGSELIINDCGWDEYWREFLIARRSFAAFAYG